MPLYNVEHSFPLTLEQRKDLAGRITKLHAETFTTPSLFVQVKFYQQDVSSQNHYIGGVLVESSINRIIGYVRSSSSRTKAHWDKLAEQVEHAWYVVVGEASDDEEDEEKKKKDKNTPEFERLAKELVSVAFVTGIVVREKGYAIPEAGEEQAWFKKFREEFEHKAELGDAGFKGMVDEVDSREDLKGWRDPEKEKEKAEKKEAEKKKAEEEKNKETSKDAAGSGS